MAVTVLEHVSKENYKIYRKAREYHLINKFNAYKNGIN